MRGVFVQGRDSLLRKEVDAVANSEVYGESDADEDIKREYSGADLNQVVR